MFQVVVTVPSGWTDYNRLMERFFFQPNPEAFQPDEIGVAEPDEEIGPDLDQESGPEPGSELDQESDQLSFLED